MTTLTIYDPLAELLDYPDPVQRCRFCGCTEANPCSIAIVEESDGKFRLARTPEEMTEDFPCNWYLPGVCNAPACIEKLIEESRVRLFGEDGRKLA